VCHPPPIGRGAGLDADPLLERATSEVVRTGEIVRNVRELVQNRQRGASGWTFAA
jgi:hypothetical protein